MARTALHISASMLIITPAEYMCAIRSVKSRRNRDLNVLQNNYFKLLYKDNSKRKSQNEKILQVFDLTSFFIFKCAT